jgi:DNA modification methylase
VVTSPPYWNKKNYGSIMEQIGYYHSYEQYIQELNLVWKECIRLLLPQGRLCINIGDVFTSAKEYGRYKVLPVHSEIIQFCEQNGLDYMNMIVWRKIGNAVASGGARNVMGSYLMPPNGIVQNEIEYILIFKKPSAKRRKVCKEIKELSALDRDKEWIPYFSQIWDFPGVRQKGHLAMFPEELPKRLIKMFSFVGDTVLDPFLGSGTTVRVARNLGRNSLGVEINPQYLPLIKQRLAMGQEEGIDAEEIEIIDLTKEQNQGGLKLSLTNWEQEIDLERALNLFKQGLEREKKEFKSRGLDGISPFLQVSLLGKNKVFSSFLCVEMVIDQNELTLKATNPINNFTIDNRLIEKIVFTEQLNGGEKGVYLIFHLTGGIKGQVCISREIA